MGYLRKYGPFLIFVTFIQSLVVASTSDFEEFVVEIEEFINSTTSYVLPTDNSQYFGDANNSETATYYGSYDFIIVGAGTAGGVLANRLTEIENFTVLAIEAGKEDPPISEVLGLLSYLSYSDWNWGYYTTSQAAGCQANVNQKCPFQRGKGLGGSSTINGGFYTHGNPENFDKWVELGNDGWSFAECLPYFKKAEKAEFTLDIDESYHGFSGPLHTNVPSDTPILTEAILDAFIEIGKDEGDYNGASQFAISRPQYVLDGNIRSSVAREYIRPAMERDNLEIILESLATKILIDNVTATGVEFWTNGIKYYATATKEVILSGGTINSPQLLMLSGIGPQDELDKHDIELIADLPVGLNLADHVSYEGLFYKTNYSFYDNTVEENLELWRLNQRPYTAGYGCQTATYYNIEQYTNSSDVEVLGIGPPSVSSSIGKGYIEGYSAAFEVLNSTTDIAISILLMQPRSAGVLTLQSSDPRDFPLIDVNILSDPQDLEVLYEAVQTISELINTTAFASLGAEQIVLDLPDCDTDYEKLSKDWWICNIKYTSRTTLHPIGTTRMGIDPETSVVGPDLKVHGIDRLRVVDAGVMPSHVSAHSMASVVMIAEKIADLIKNEYC